MKGHEIRQTFVDYFKKNGHEPASSSSLIPENDNTLLFANAGMNQFKNLFLGLEHRNYKRAVTSQKCVRAGGKHNDLENVGFTARHHTFFEMLGNFSFGDYFKKDAIHFAWELLTKELQIPKDKLYVTVFETDDEAADIWHKQEGVSRDRIYRFGEKDNFWRMGDTGPCGPCTEIFYDHGPEADIDPSKPSKMGGDGDRFVEIWNLVFMQFNEDGNGQTPLPKPSVDTGGGLERWAAVLQGKPNNYDTDLFLPIIETAARVSKKDYESNLKILAKNPQLAAQTAAMRVVADHSRATAFLLADGVLPSNEGRGYVLRRIIRRAVRYASKLTNDPSLFLKTVQTVADQMQSVYPELKSQRSRIDLYTQEEIQRFLATLDQGTQILETRIRELQGRGVKKLDGEWMFKLYDTYGFPADLTRLMASEQGFSVDENDFEKRMEDAKAKARSSWKGKALAQDATHLIQLAQKAKDQKGATEFSGYAETRSFAKVISLSNGFKEVSELKAGETGIAIFEKTPFYGESGGQAGDIGTITTKSGVTVEVSDCTKQNEIHLHHLRVQEGVLKIGDECELQVVESARRATASNHSATHLLHAALRKVLGTHVTQAGSLVEPDRLRFDFTHNKPLTPAETLEIEQLVNGEIAKAIAVGSKEMNYKEAIQAGAMALFGEKYGDNVRVIRMGEFSTELCGGTHVSNTSVIRAFKIVSEAGVSSGVRRIEALTGDGALKFLLKHTQENIESRALVGLQENWSTFLASGDDHKSIRQWIESTRDQIKQLEKEIGSLKGQQVNADDLISHARSLKKGAQAFKLLTADVALDDRKVLSELSDKLRDKLGSGVVVIVGKGADSHPILVSVSKDLTAHFSAGKLLGEIAPILGGRGGGRPDFAQGAGPDRSRLSEAFARAEKYLAE